MFDESAPLKHLNSFQRLLKGYKPSLESLDLLQNNTFVILTAPSAAGRNTIIKNLIMTGKYYFVISDTTRPPRINNGTPERSGEEYWFKSEEEFLHGLKNGRYIEAAIIHNQQISGISIDEIRRGTETGRILISDMDIQGADSIKSFSDKTITVFVLPPNFEEWMRRLDGRGAMSNHEKRRRLISATEEIELALKRSYFKFIINWDLNVTIDELHEHVLRGAFDEAEQQAAQSHARQLLIDLSKWLA
jgi:guanylate kinase